MLIFQWIAYAQIILESFPISSSGHLALLQRFIADQHALVDVCSKPVMFFLHLPTALVILIFFVQSVWHIFKYIKRTWLLILKISALTICADTITVCGYLVCEFFGKPAMPLYIGFALTAGCLFSLRWCRRMGGHWDVKKACTLGTLQAVAFVPGISRFALTYVAARWMGIRSKRAFQISLLIEWPLIVVAGVYGLYHLYVADCAQLLSLTGSLSIFSASILAYLSLCLVAYMIRRECLWLWGIYMFVPIMLAWYWGV